MLAVPAAAGVRRGSEDRLSMLAALALAPDAGGTPKQR